MAFQEVRIALVHQGAMLWVYEGGERKIKPEAWYLPGGNIEEKVGENIVAAARRELLEEVGIRASAHTSIKWHGGTSPIFLVVMRDPEGTLQPNAEHGIWEARWFRFSVILKGGIEGADVNHLAMAQDAIANLYQARENPTG